MIKRKLIPKLKKNKGFTLVELILTLAVVATISFMSFQSMTKQFETQQAESFGSQIKNIGVGVNNYIVNHYDVLSKLTNSTGSTQDPGPRTCTPATQTCEITTQTLVNEGMLPPVFSNKNIYGSGYKIIISRKGSSPYWNISALISTDRPLRLSGSIRYDLLGLAMQEAGVDSGMTRTSANKVDGYKGSWSATSSDFSNINQQGLLAYIAGYGSNSYSAFLRRDGTLPMTGDLNMGTKNIYGAANITASGKGTFGGEVEAGAWVHARNGYGDLVSFGGDASANDYEIRMDADKPLSIHMKSNRNDITALNVTGGVAVSGILNTTGNITAGGQIIGHNGGGDAYVIGGGDANDYEFRLGSNKPLTLWRSGGLSSEQRLQVWGRQDNTGDLYVKGDGNSSGSITASGNITSSKVVAGQYIYPTSIVAVGSACPQNGYVSKDATGQLLSCVSGRWASVGNLPIGSPVPWPSNTPPTGWLICNGQAFNMAAYPQLAKAYPSGRLPDLRGVFIRGLDAGRGLDSGRAINSYQDDQIQNITGYMPADIGQSGYIGKYVGGAFADSGAVGGGDQGYRGGEVRRYTFDASRVVRAGNETRPKNVAMNYIVQAQ